MTDRLDGLGDSDPHPDRAGGLNRHALEVLTDRLRDAEVPWDNLRSERALRALTSRIQRGEILVDSATSSRVPARALQWAFGAAGVAATLALAAGLWTLREGSTGDVSNVAVSAATETRSAPETSRSIDAEGSSRGVHASATRSSASAASGAEADDVPVADSMERNAGKPVLAFSGGRIEAVLEDAASVELVAEDRGHVVLNQAAGAVTYTVDRSADLQVKVSQLRVSVGGASFHAAIDRMTITVAVLDGTVRIQDGAREFSLGVGESIRLERSEPSTVATATVVTAAEDRTHDRVEARGPEELMREADASLKSGDLDESAALLEAVVRGTGGRSHSVAWIELGRVQRARGRFVAAAEAFESYVEALPNGPLAEDARVLAAESWRAAGRSDEARRAAAAYLVAFPNGLHAQRVRAFAP